MWGFSLVKKLCRKGNTIDAGFAASQNYYNVGSFAFMSKIIAVTSGKGGTGKSSISACLGYALAKQGNRTLIIELDFGLRCMDIMLGMQGNITYDLGDVL